MCPNLSSAYRAADRRAAGIHELNIGHAIVTQAMFVGWRDAVAEMKRMGGRGLIGLVWIAYNTGRTRWLNMPF
jgi:hypothetical protein